MKRDPTRGVLKIASFLNVTLSEAQVEKIVENTSFGSMRNKEANGQMSLKMHPDSFVKLRESVEPTKLDGVMTRHGANGDWAVELRPEAQEYVTKTMAQHLDRELVRHFFRAGGP